MISFCALATLVAVHAEKMSGTVNPYEDGGLSFLGKFVFQDLNFYPNMSSVDKVVGWVDVDLTNLGSKGASLYELVMYDDQENSFPAIYDNADMSCMEKFTGNHKRRHEPVVIDSDETVQKTLGIKQHLRPRWWWLYLLNCNLTADTATDIDFDVHFVQNTTVWLKKELGANDWGLPISYSVFLVIYVLLCAVQMYAYFVYKRQQYIHQVIKLLTAVIFLQLFAVGFHFMDWMLFADSGVHEVFVPVVAHFAQVAGATVFLLLLLVLAQGWTVSRFEVLYPKALFFGCLLIGIVNCALYLWALIGLDPETTTWRYNSTPMYIYGSIYLVIGVVFLCTCLFSYKNESLDGKRKLYLLLSVFTIWFASPLMNIFIADSFADQARDRFALVIQLTITTLTYFVMMMLLWPSWAHQYFNLSMIDSQRQMMQAESVNDDALIPQVPAPSSYKVLEQDRL